MTNQEIIIEGAIENGIYTKEEIDIFIKEKKDIPLHTASQWMKMGYSVKTGVSPLYNKRLWCFRPARNGNDTDSGFYCKDTAIYGIDQVERRLNENRN